MVWPTAKTDAHHIVAVSLDDQKGYYPISLVEEWFDTLTVPQKSSSLAPGTAPSCMRFLPGNLLHDAVIMRGHERGFASLNEERANLRMVADVPGQRHSRSWSVQAKHRDS